MVQASPNIQFRLYCCTYCTAIVPKTISNVMDIMNRSTIYMQRFCQMLRNSVCVRPFVTSCCVFTIIMYIIHKSRHSDACTYSVYYSPHYCTFCQSQAAGLPRKRVGQVKFLAEKTAPRLKNKSQKKILFAPNFSLTQINILYLN